MGSSIPLSTLLPEVVALAQRAGAAVMEVYARHTVGARDKAPGSPVTDADLASHDVIVAGLRALTPEVPVLSEESASVAYAVRREWPAFWLVDPLDGTKEFISRNGEFTVNIALVDGRQPVLGVVHAPAVGATYFAAKGVGAFKAEAGAPRPIGAGTERAPRLRVVASRSHSGPETEAFLARLGAVDRVSMGSSLKLCLVAEGQAHLYPRFGPTMEWDTAAAQCVVEIAGGAVTDLGGRPLVYNKPDLHNPGFMVSDASGIPWREHVLDITGHAVKTA
jgi:3'(2'), 5'-bisphosphate nucleotidase